MENRVLKLVETMAPTTTAEDVCRYVRLDMSDLENDEQDLQEIPRVVNALLLENPVSGYWIEENSGTCCWGADNAWQQVTLGISCGVAGSVASPIVQNLIQWARDQWRGNDEPVSLDAAVALALGVLKDDLDLRGKLHVIKASSSKDGDHSIIIESPKPRYRYEVKVSLNGRLTEIVRQDNDLGSAG